MKIVLASESKVKIAAVQAAFADSSIELVTVNVPSGVPEQPMDNETLNGAFNRLGAAREKIPGADLYIAIESGIFKEDGNYVDRAIVAIAQQENEKPSVTYSDGVTFPVDAVQEAQKRGFDTWTVGKVMAEMGIIKNHADPHLDLSGKSRADYIAGTMKQARLALE